VVEEEDCVVEEEDCGVEVMTILINNYAPTAPNCKKTIQGFLEEKIRIHLITGKDSLKKNPQRNSFCCLRPFRSNLCVLTPAGIETITTLDRVNNCPILPFRKIEISGSRNACHAPSTSAPFWELDQNFPSCPIPHQQLFQKIEISGLRNACHTPSTSVSFWEKDQNCASRP